MKKEGIILKGSVMGINTRTGEVAFKKDNMIVQTGLNELAKLVANKGGVFPTHIAVGTSNVAPDLGDVALKGSELARAAFEAVEVTAGSIKFSATFAPGVATGVWEETGLFTADSAGIMYSRALTGTYTKGAKDEIKVFWTYSFSNKA